MSRLNSLSLALALTGLTAAPVQAGPTFCAERAQIAERLETRFAEQLVGGGLQSQDGVVEIWTTATGATWTILMTRPDGVSCVMATGTDWFSRKFQALPEGVAG